MKTLEQQVVSGLESVLSGLDSMLEKQLRMNELNKQPLHGPVREGPKESFMSKVKGVFKNNKIRFFIEINTGMAIVAGLMAAAFPLEVLGLVVVTGVAVNYYYAISDQK